MARGRFHGGGRPRHRSTRSHDSPRERADNVEESPELQILDPRRLCFQRHGATLRLTVEGECSYLRATARRAFPLSAPDGHISVRDGQRGEIGVIVDPRELDDASRGALEEELARRYVIPIITRVISVKERFGTVDWTIETDRGMRTFTTRNLREDVVKPSPGRYLLTDVDGNRYDTADISALDSASRAMLLEHL